MALRGRQGGDAREVHVGNQQVRAALQDIPPDVRSSIHKSVLYYNSRGQFDGTVLLVFHRACEGNIDGHLNADR